MFMQGVFLKPFFFKGGGGRAEAGKVLLGADDGA